MNKIYTLLALLITLNVQGQLNLDSLGRINFIQTHATGLNDIWGYVDETGKEYALVGAEKGTSVVDVTVPSTPVEVAWIPGMQSIWRDLKTFGDYAYVTTEASNGLLIIDLSPLPASTTLPTTLYTGLTGMEWTSAHNLYIDEQGYAYIFGPNRGNKGVIILDVFTDPMNPVEVGNIDDWYVHDGYAQNDTLYLANIYEGFISIFDVADRSNPVLLGTKTTVSTFAHNVWVSSNGQYAFTTDEVQNGFVGAYDGSDPANVVELDRIQSSPGSNVIPHNTHVKGNHIITSWYADGVVVHDVTHPYNMVEVGYYRTYPQQTTGYDGCWGVYPFLPSGNILATDRSEGLFILGSTYVQAAYLEGVITDANTSALLDQVEVEILGPGILDQSGLNGFYATGTVNGGTYDVFYHKVGYYPQTISTTINNGVITTQDVALVPIPPYSLTVRVFEEGTSTPVDNAQILMEAALLSHQGITNGLGEEVLTLYYEETYMVTVGKWGYITYCDQIPIDNATGTIDVYLRKGYYDDFTFDFGWTTSNTASTGLWERGEPFGTDANAAPDVDVITDCGKLAFVTGNETDFYIDADDIDNGIVILTSPVMDLTGYADPYINYSQWYYCFHGPNPTDDTLEVILSNGFTSVTLEKTGPDNTITPLDVNWEQRSFRILDFISPSSTMQVIIKAEDIGNVNITEAGIDHFFIAEETELGLMELSQELFVYPNPAEQSVFIGGLTGPQSYRLLSMDGHLIVSGEVDVMNNEVRFGNAPTGLYLLEVGSKVFKVLRAN